MLLREVVGRGVFDVAGAQTVSTVRTAVIDPAEQRVIGFRVDGASPILALEDLKAIGHDKVTVDTPDRLRQARSTAEQRSVEHNLDPITARVLADDGTALGVADDVDFDPETGAIHAIVVAGSRLSGDRVLGIGPYALVVAAS